MGDAFEIAVNNAEAGEDHVITRQGEPVAVVIGYAKYQDMIDRLGVLGAKLGESFGRSLRVSGDQEGTSG